MKTYDESAPRRGGTVLEGRAGLAVALVLGVAALALMAAEWVLLPEQVVVQFGVTGEHYGPKAVIVLVTAALGLGGAGWLGATRAKAGLLLAAVGVGLAIVTLAVNLVLY